MITSASTSSSGRGNQTSAARAIMLTPIAQITCM